MSENEELSFARKYRPKTLEEYIGNTRIKDTFRRIMASGKRPQTILLTGNTGCGKTTLSRIIANWYMCENPSEDGSPCGCCTMCEYMREYIETGNSEMLADLKEIDVTASGGKNDIEAIIEEMYYPAFGGGWKVYFFDECHKLSESAGNRLLKVAEEPPANVMMIFGTTDPQKMLETLKNRCTLKLQVTKPNTTELCSLLRKVCLSVDKEYDMSGLRMICTRSDYVIRDSLQNLETVLASRGSAKGDRVSEEFQEVSDRLIFDFYEAYLNKDVLGYVGLLYRIKTVYNFEQFLQSLINFTTRGIYILNNITVEGLAEDEIKSYLGVFSRFSVDEISFVLSSLLKMGVGNIEANFMSFIYCQNNNTVSDKPNIVVPSETSLNESKFRNDNLKAKEDAKLEEGKKSLGGLTDEVSFDSVMGLFNLEKVD